MKKLFAVLLSCTIMLTAAGCRNESAPAEQAAVPAATTPIVTTTTVKPVNIEGLDLVLAGIKNIPMGTAGSSLKCAAVSALTLQWTTEHDCDFEPLTAAVKKYFDSLDEEGKSSFKMNFESVDFFTRMIIKGQEEAKNLLDDAGVAINFSINSAKYEAFSAAVKSAVA